MGFGNSSSRIADLKEARAAASRRYDDGFKDGENDAHADWHLAITEAVDLPAPHEPQLWGPQETAAYIVTLQDTVRQLSDDYQPRMRCSRAIIIGTTDDPRVMRCRRHAGHPQSDALAKTGNAQFAHATDPLDNHPDGAVIVLFMDDADNATTVYEPTQPEATP